MLLCASRGIFKFKCLSLNSISCNMLRFFVCLQNSDFKNGWNNFLQKWNYLMSGWKINFGEFRKNLIMSKTGKHWLKIVHTDSIITLIIHHTYVKLIKCVIFKNNTTLKLCNVLYSENWVIITTNCGDKTYITEANKRSKQDHHNGEKLL